MRIGHARRQARAFVQREFDGIRRAGGGSPRQPRRIPLGLGISLLRRSLQSDLSPLAAIPLRPLSRSTATMPPPQRRRLHRRQERMPLFVRLLIYCIIHHRAHQRRPDLSSNTIFSLLIACLAEYDPEIARHGSAIWHELWTALFKEHRRCPAIAPRHSTTAAIRRARAAMSVRECAASFGCSGLQKALTAAPTHPRSAAAGKARNPSTFLRRRLVAIREVTRILHGTGSPINDKIEHV